MIALSIRQPWAWLILHGGKDVENRTWPTKVRGRILIHAAKGMEDWEWEDGWSLAYDIDRDLADRMPALESPDLSRGGIIGQVEIVDCVRRSASAWFSGPCGFVLRDPRVIPFYAVRGQLGFFEVPWPPTGRGL